MTEETPITLGDKWDIDGSQYEDDEHGKLFGFDEPPTLDQKLLASLAESAMVRQAFEAAWDESQHPRAEDGKFTDGAGGEGAKSYGKSSDFPAARSWMQTENPKLEPGEKQRVGLTGTTRTVKADLLAQYVRPELGKVMGGRVQNADGSWRGIQSSDLTPEVQRLFKEIIADELKGRTPVGNPTATILGGGPGSGKSTVARQFGLGDKDGVKNNFVTINADELRAKLPWAAEAYAKATGPLSVAQYHEMASLLSNDLMKAAAAGRYNTVLDGTGDSSFKKLEGRLSDFRAAGHEIVGMYVTTSIAGGDWKPTITGTGHATDAETRAMHRAAKAEAGSADRRLVPMDILHEAHIGVSQVFPVATDHGLFDRWTLHDTSGKSPVLVASGHGKTRITHDDGRWQQFLHKGTMVTKTNKPHVFAAGGEPLDMDTYYSLVAALLNGETPEWANPPDIERAQKAIDDTRELGFEPDIPHEIAGRE